MTDVENLLLLEGVVKAGAIIEVAYEKNDLEFDRYEFLKKYAIGVDWSEFNKVNMIHRSAFQQEMNYQTS